MGSVYLIYKPGRRFDTLSTFSMILRRNKTKTFENCCSCWSQISNKLKLKGYTWSSMAHLKHPKLWVGIKWVGTTVLWSRDMRCIPILGKITIFKYFSWIPYRVNMGDDWKGSLKKKKSHVHVFFILHPTCLFLPVSEGCACTTGTMVTDSDLPQFNSVLGQKALPAQAPQSAVLEPVWL